MIKVNRTSQICTLVRFSFKFRSTLCTKSSIFSSLSLSLSDGDKNPLGQMERNRKKTKIHLLLAVSYLGTALQMLIKNAQIAINPQSLKRLSIFVGVVCFLLVHTIFLRKKRFFYRTRTGLRRNSFFFFEDFQEKYFALMMNTERMIPNTSDYQHFIRYACHR